jgi:hypothetical protein
MDEDPRTGNHVSRAGGKRYRHVTRSTETTTDSNEMLGNAMEIDRLEKRGITGRLGLVRRASEEEEEKEEEEEEEEER